VCVSEFCQLVLQIEGIFFNFFILSNILVSDLSGSGELEISGKLVVSF
jgi:hypothetical protein